MNDFWQEFVINNAIGVVLATVKNPDSKKKMRKAFLKIYLTIKAVYATDEEFQ